MKLINHCPHCDSSLIWPLGILDEFDAHNSIVATIYLFRCKACDERFEVRIPVEEECLTS